MKNEKICPEYPNYQDIYKKCCIAFKLNTYQGLGEDIFII